jgi:hypothetical protein
VAATALWLGAKLEEVPEVSQHPEKLVRKVLVTVDRICSRREDAKPSLLELSSKVGVCVVCVCVRAHARICVRTRVEGGAAYGSAGCQGLRWGGVAYALPGVFVVS